MRAVYMELDDETVVSVAVDDDGFVHFYVLRGESRFTSRMGPVVFGAFAGAIAAALEESRRAIDYNAAAARAELTWTR